MCDAVRNTPGAEPLLCCMTGSGGLANAIAGTALFIISIIAISHGSISNLANLTIGFSITGMVGSALTSCTDPKSIFAVLIYAIILTLGILHLRGQLNSHQLGSGVLITQLAPLGIALLGTCCVLPCILASRV